VWRDKKLSKARGDNAMSDAQFGFELANRLHTMEALLDKHEKALQFLYNERDAKLKEETPARERQ
jgi:hypothetical protein